GQACAGAGAHPAQVVRDLRERDGDRAQGAGRLDEAVAVGLRLERVGGRVDLEAGVAGQPRAHARGEVRVGVQAGAGGGAAEGDLREPLEGRVDAGAALADLGRVAP